MIKEVNIYTENYGCTSNLFDYEIIRGLLKKSGCLITEDRRSANALIINSCGVKKQTEDKILYRLRQFASTGKPLIVTGCLPKINKSAVLKAAPLSYTLDQSCLYKLPEIIENTTGKKINKHALPRASIKIDMPRSRTNKLREIIQISEGCIGECTYCCTKNARGRLISYPVDAIVKTIGKAVKEGVKEIYLTSQDTGSYGLDINSNLINLLKKVVQVPGKFKVRIGMMNPDRAKVIIEPLINLIKESKMYRFLHIPVQSGSNVVLADMKRRYTNLDFIELVKTLRKDIDDITISTDIIVGYPTETEDDFQKTLRLLKDTKPEIVNVSRYTPRPLTEAAEINPLSQEDITPRLKKVVALCREIRKDLNKLLLNRKLWGLVVEKSSKGNYIIRTDNYQRVIISSEENLLGKGVRFRIYGFTERYLLGSLL